MKHRTLTAALGLLVAAILIPTGLAQAASADPTGIWRKAKQGERPGKMQVYRCGRSKKLLCVKIVWLQNPLDSKGKPLHDVRNTNASMRARPILGLQIVNGMQPVSANQWKGSIYNPEDGNTFSATLTLVSRNQIHLKGCKAWLLCGERTWLRTTMPKKPEVEPQIEASAKPEAVVKPVVAKASAEPEPNTLSEAEMLTPAVQDGTRPGFRFLNTATKVDSNEFSGENVPSMFEMSSLIVAQPVAPAPTPKPQNLRATAAPAPASRQAPVTATAHRAPVPADAQTGPIETDETENAEVAIVDQAPLSRRQRRLLRRQQQSQGLFPWLR
jgi:uncharacterized protein (DUF2147 family)